jgi:uncharacterized protein with NRDE domain
MCTLILGRDVIESGSVVVAANRDEDPSRPAVVPGILAPKFGVVGGRDQLAGGTWLAVRGRQFGVAMLNRRPPSRPIRADRSRGLLALDVAAAAAPRAAAAAAVRRDSYAPFTLVGFAAGDVWLLAWDGTATWQEVGPGWHVLTHADLDDPDEPRTARLLNEISAWRPASLDAAEAGLRVRLAAHDDPAVCIHDGRMPTVSYALVFLARDRARYLHGEGRPCVKSPDDYSHLLAAPAAAPAPP